MKRIISIALLSSFLFSIAGYYFLFLVMDSQNRNEMQSALVKETSLQAIHIHKSEIKNILFKKEGKEFCLNGEMYDVKSKSEEGDYIVFHCKHDKKETKLLAGLDKHVQYNSDSKSPSDKKQNDSSKNPVKDLFFSEKNSVITPSFIISFSNENCKLQIVNLPFPSIPPEVSIS